MLQSATLSSASILLAILTALYGLFYPAIKETIDLEVLKGARAKDNGPSHDKAVKAFNGKALPLALGALLIALVYIPELYKQATASIGYLADYGIKGTEYDITAAAFMAVGLFILMQAVNIIRLGLKTFNKMRKLRVPKKDDKTAGA